MRVELLKLRRPAIGFVVLFALLSAFSVVALAQASDAEQWAVVAEGRAAIDTPQGVREFCRVMEVEGQECTAAVAQQQAENERFRRELIENEPFGAVLQSPMGALGVAAGLMASWHGLLLISALAGLHVAGEWSGGTARVLLSGRVSRSRYYFQKLASIFAASIGLLLTLFLGLLLVTPILGVLYEVGPLPSGFNVGEYSMSQLGRSVPVLVFFCSIAVTAATAIRHVLGSMAAVIVVGFVALVLAGARDLVPWSPAYWVSSVMKFDARGAFHDHFWPDVFPLGTSRPVPLDVTLGYAALGATSLSAVAIGALLLRRMEVD